jgi:hypothetical protein
MSLNRTAMEASLALNKVATAPGVGVDQRITALSQVQRQLDGLMVMLRAERESLNLLSQAESS